MIVMGGSLSVLGGTGTLSGLDWEGLGNALGILEGDPGVLGSTGMVPWGYWEALGETGAPPWLYWDVMGEGRPYWEALGGLGSLTGRRPAP